MTGNQDMLNDKIDEKLSFSIIFFFIIQSANSTIKTVFPNLGNGFNAALSIGSGLVILYMLLSSMKEVYKMHPFVLIRSYALFGVIYIISIIQNVMRGAPIDVLLKESMLWTMVWWIPMGLICYSIKNRLILYRTMLKWSYVLSVVTLLSVYAYFMNIIDVNVEMLNRGNYNMFFSYMLVLPLIIHLNEIIDNRNIKALFFFLFELIGILVYGSRGALLCVVSFSILKFLIGGLKTITKFRLSVLVILLVSAFLLGVSAIAEDLEDAGLTSRTLEMFIDGSVSESDGRGSLRTYTMELISERPLLGYGLGGEFSELYSKAYGVPAKPGEYSSLTPHNGFLQLILNFGICVGLIVCIIIVIPILWIRQVRDMNCRILLIILFSVYIVPSLTVSDGIFIKPGIALYLFLVLRWCHDLRKESKEIVYEYSKS